MTRLRNHWGPSSLGRLFTRSPHWRLTFSADRYRLTLSGEVHDGNLVDLKHLPIVSGTFWSTLTFPLSFSQSAALGGIRNPDAKELAQTIASAVRRIHIADLIKDFDGATQPIVRWVSAMLGACRAQFSARGWLTEEFKNTQTRLKPTGLAELLSEPAIAEHLSKQSKSLKDAVALWQRDFRDVANELNERHVASELTESNDFFRQVEKSPLTEEQARAVLCFDNRVLLVAAAGSGKTSTMVAKAGYALKRAYFAPEKILLLAFNKDAASELRERIKTRLGPMAVGSEAVAAKTFHAFGLEVIGAATGKRPSVAPWLESGQDLEVLLELVDDLKDRNPVFRANWDLFRIVLGQDLPEFGKEQESPDSWDRDRKAEGFWTLNGEVVKSRGEQIIANWLFYNGVRYQYETPYKIETADASHRQYHPDFYLVDVDAYLEHWAVDEKGEPPAEFKGYKEGMAWKRKLHAENGTSLLETTMAELWSGQAFRYLVEELSRRGITLDPNPDRPAKGRKPIENPRLARTFKTFLTHVKSNRLSVPALRKRFASEAAGRFQFRHQMFLSLFEKVWSAWEARLKADGYIDFEDMLGLAAECLESGQWKSPYELVMVDEFQDVSQSRARLIAGLLKAPGRCLFAVGDDWQSVNRFAGSDLAVMTDFERTFGKAYTLKLETTFRCPQSLCDITSSFIQKNPSQLRKRVRSVKEDVQQPVCIIRVDDEAKIQSAVAKRIHELVQQSVLEKPIHIYVLGRYRKEQSYVPLAPANKLVRVEFVTAHSSKGLEADHVIVPRMTSETLGFPSRVEDDPVLQLAMPSGDEFQEAEERRLFYVAMTRAKSTVTLITVARKESPFIAELVKDSRLEVLDVEGESVATHACSACGKGLMVQRSGRYGPFLGCSRFPRCSNTERIRS